MVRLSTLDLNHIKTAVLHRQTIYEQNNTSLYVESNEECLFGKNVKIIHNLGQRPVCLTAEEKDELTTKYEKGMTMSALACEYGCHYTTVGRILRKRGVGIRDTCHGKQ